MSDLRDLYQEVILDHNRHPRNFGAVEHADCKVDGHNPLCGDKLTLFVRLDGDRIADVGFTGAGCAISKASASLMTDAVKGKTVAEAAALFDSFHEMVMAGADAGSDPARLERLGKLAVFLGVSEYPTRVKCATLAWHTLHAALARSSAPVSTENETE
jgi:nitrogen fixation NifU-like protein